MIWWRDEWAEEWVWFGVAVFAAGGGYGRWHRQWLRRKEDKPTQTNQTPNKESEVNFLKWKQRREWNQTCLMKWTSAAQWKEIHWAAHQAETLPRGKPIHLIFVLLARTAPSKTKKEMKWKRLAAPAPFIPPNQTNHKPIKLKIWWFLIVDLLSFNYCYNIIWFHQINSLINSFKTESFDIIPVNWWNWEMKKKTLVFLLNGAIESTPAGWPKRAVQLINSNQ